MNETIKTLLTRRSIRKYKNDEVPQELIDQIIEAGLYAASGMGKQSSIIISITNKEERENFRKINGEIMNADKDADPFYGAPVILLVLSDKNSSNAQYDGSLIMGNMMNAAHALGLGSVWINRARQEFEMDFGKQFLERHNIKGDYVGIGHLALGYKDEEDPVPAKRKENRVYYVK